ncbi:hypothetical protein LUZ60_007688 [Juncus effusus]|nr:hypothetical protein LUZ60_007688 [Juncus effusus]
MAPWWKAKSKSKTSPRKEDDHSCRNKAKANKSFDEALIIENRKSIDRSVAHPLPRPLSSPLPTIPQEHAAAAASASVSDSSVSSCGSDEAPDLGLYRGRTIPSYNNPHNHSKHRHLSVSPRKEFHSHSLEPPTSAARKSMEAVLVRHGPGLSNSPVHPKSTVAAHPLPLPLPPVSFSYLQSQWKKGKLLGRGTFGHVYLGFNSENGQMCAIKEVSVISDDSNSRESLKQLNQEISLLSHLSHPNIVQYYGSEPMDDTLLVYLEYISGGSIYKLLQEYGPFKEPVIRNYTAQILSGLAYLHGKNTVHRDIKGANILVDPNGDVKLADFGMAKHMSAYTSIRSFKGSPYWMAPEIIMNVSGYNLSVDIWSLGCTILEMATSKPPWSQFEGVAAIFKIGNSKDIPEIPEHLSLEAKNFLKLCLQRDPLARPTAVELLSHPFVREQVLRTPKPNNATEFSNRSISPLREKGSRTRNLSVFPSVMHHTSYKTSKDQCNMRANFSLPVSPCSSPSRQFNKQTNRSCLPSPPHPAFSAGAISYSPINNSLYPQRPINGLLDPSLDFAQMRVNTPFDSPRRL